MIIPVIIFVLLGCNYSYYIEVMEGTNFCVSDDYASGTLVQGHYRFEVEKTVANKKPVDVLVIVKDVNNVELLHSLQNSTGHFSFASSAGEHTICFETKTTMFTVKRKLYMFLDIRTGLEEAPTEEPSRKEQTPEKFFGSIDAKVLIYV
jgi:hypothetical protein